MQSKLFDNAITAFCCKEKYVIPGDRPEVRKPLLEWWKCIKSAGTVEASVTHYPKMQLYGQPANLAALLSSSGKQSETELPV